MYAQTYPLYAVDRTRPGSPPMAVLSWLPVESREDNHYLPELPVVVLIGPSARGHSPIAWRRVGRLAYFTDLREAEVFTNRPVRETPREGSAVIPQGTTLYAVTNDDDSTTVYLVIGWNPVNGNPFVVPLNVPSQSQAIELARDTVTFTETLPQH